MKDLFREIKEVSANKFTQRITIEKDMVNQLHELLLIHLLTLVESATKAAQNLLDDVAVDYTKKLIKSEFQNLGKAFEGDEIELESRFYGIDKRTVELKVFVRRFEKNGKSTKIARAIYTFQAEFKDKSAA